MKLKLAKPQRVVDYLGLSLVVPDEAKYLSADSYGGCKKNPRRFFGMIMASCSEFEFKLYDIAERYDRPPFPSGSSVSIEKSEIGKNDRERRC